MTPATARPHGRALAFTLVGAGATCLLLGVARWKWTAESVEKIAYAEARLEDARRGASEGKVKDVLDILSGAARHNQPDRSFSRNTWDALSAAPLPSSARKALAEACPSYPAANPSGAGCEGRALHKLALLRIEYRDELKPRVLIGLGSLCLAVALAVLGFRRRRLRT
jgi:hypothetical protein